MNTSEHLTPADAAKLAGVSRATIVRALQAGDLLARRDNSGRWHIDPAELSAWRERRAATTVHRSTVNTDHRRETEHFLRAEIARLRDVERDHAAELARLTAEASAAAARLADATAERDAWRAQAAALATRQEPTEERRQSFTLFRLFRRDH